MAPTTQAFVTLLTSDSYLPGVLTCINSLLDVEGVHPNTPFKTVCLVTPATVGQAAIKALEKTFDQVVGVEEITTTSWAELDLLGRRDLSATLTKLHVFRLTQFDKVIYLDADTLVLQPLSHLFETRHPFAACPDQGWPDAFNSGFMVLTPNEADFSGLVKMMGQRGSWDGGDQGLLNDYFRDWQRLSFTYNVTPSAYYQYKPAYQRHEDDVKVLHFIGDSKPWSRGTRASPSSESTESDYYNLQGKWFDAFERHFGMGHTRDVASRVVQPPASFKKDNFVNLSPRHIPTTVQSSSSSSSRPVASDPGPRYSTGTPQASTRQSTPSTSSLATPIPIRTSSPPTVTWDPARSSPPRDPSALQMREAITSRYENVWDDPSKEKQNIRFEPPQAFPVVPPSTHEWYKSVMVQGAPDPHAVKAVFPWEKVNKPIPSRVFPTEEKEQLVEKGVLLTSSGEVSPTTTTSRMTFANRSPFVNAWDSVPAINRYAQNLAKMKLRPPSSVVTSPPGEDTIDSMGGRLSSLAEPPIIQDQDRGDASSRDGDDEEEESEATSSAEETDVDKYSIQFKVQGGGAYGSKGRLSPVLSKSSSLFGGSGSSPPTSPGKTSSSRTGSQSGDGGSPGMSPRRDSSSTIRKSPPTTERSPILQQSSRAFKMTAGRGVVPTVSATGRPLSPVATLSIAERRNSPPQGAAPSASHPSLILSKPLGLRLSTAAPLPTALPPAAGGDSPRLAAQALRNSTAARLSASGTGNGNGPPVARATRYFPPETDTSVVKQQGLAALQRFVQDMEKEAVEKAATNGGANGGN